MAPELIKGETYDLLVDYWAIGCILFEMLFGNYNETVKQRNNEKPMKKQ